MGKILKFKGIKQDKKSGDDIPIGEYEVGKFVMRANVHRPLVSKDFLAFQ